MDLLIIAGETSGDQRAAEVVAELLTISPRLDIAAFGGPALERAGARLIYDMTHLALIGVTGALRNIGTIARLSRQVTGILKKDRPRAVMLVDFPGFNRPVAAKAKKLGIPVIYFISPQVWAWMPGRAKKIARVVDKMLVLFPFETPIYEKYGVDTVWVGHPMVDTVKVGRPLEDVRRQYGLGESTVVALLPGSRKAEIEYILPTMLRTAELLQNDVNNLQFCLVLAPTLEMSEINNAKTSIPLKVIHFLEDGYAIRKLAALSLVASGSATLESALLGSPTIIIYKVGFLNYLLARMVVRVKNIGLVNIVAGERIVPEFIQGDAKPELIAAAAAELLRNPEKLDIMRANLNKAASLLGPPGAARRAAEESAKVLNIH